MDPTRDAPTWTPVTGPAPTPSRQPAGMLAVRPARVLLACTDPALGDALETVLRGHAEAVAPAGIAVRRVHDGLACLQALELERPDLLVLHASLDRVGCADLLRTWREAHPGERLPVLVLSSLYLSDLPSDLRGEHALALPCDNLDLVERAARLLLDRD